MKLIIGLGNPGKEYEETRHNAGFLALDHLQKIWSGSSWKEEKKWKSFISEVVRNGEKVLLVKPQTFMNLSGESVRAVLDFYKLSPADLLVIFDDLDLPLGEVRTREKGSSGGHNGIKSLITHLGTEEFFRIKIGILSDLRTKMDAADFVLMRFSAEEMKALISLFPKVEKEAENWLEKS